MKESENGAKQTKLWQPDVDVHHELATKIIKKQQNSKPNF